MKLMIRVMVLIIFLLCMGCGRSGRKSSDLQKSVEAGEYIHLHSKGGWGIDGDIWIFSDDSFRVRYQMASDGVVRGDREGSNPGVFSRIVSLTDSLNGWQLTSDALEKEIKYANRDNGAIGVADDNHTYLKFRVLGKQLTADFYAAGIFAKFYSPHVPQIAAYAAIEEAIYKETGELGGSLPSGK
jgi:hypothetical protein